ncbi:hypothetical protein H8L32_15295 [Undibacterium sp. CY18W]|uniref:Uncharacterized protein n=1 Tax=Undibacterium hunanense TaxID=2762292 RepID=A0ABR6ZSJ1_9BURK|nr:hypothetical protein [Undibacterium hunanense]MBC3918856.1 hypothetical protein [Undibacterium hunanense]
MSLKKKLLVLSATCLLSAAATAARADGLSDLKAALARLPGQSPVKALVEAKTWSRQGEGKEQEEQNGQASILLEDSPRGLQLLFGKDLLARLEVEERAREKDPKAKTPGLAAIREVNASELRPMISAAGNLTRAMEKAIFKTEKTETYNGKPARLLSFEIPVDKLTEKERKYVKKFEGSLDIWIAADGTPIASRMHQAISGRAFVVISFETKNEEDLVYGLSGDRLIVIKKETHNSGSGAGEKGEMRVTKTLQLQS